jgi:hypothetical protein
MTPFSEISLEELKQQRAQVQKHLDWLDAKISEQSPATEIRSPDLEHPAKTLPSKGCEQTPPLAPERDATPASLTPGALEIHSDYKPKTQSEVLRAKIGCLAFFILATALFLFLLFGLPYLL